MTYPFCQYTTLPELDFETYSEAGYVYSDGKWRTLVKNTPGIKAVGASVYTEHPSARILCLAYNLHDGLGDCIWIPGMPVPERIFNLIARRDLFEAHNSIFEYRVWNNIAVPKLNWPELPLELLRCSMAKAKCWALPGKLEKAAEVLNLSEQKDKKGHTLLRRVSIPTNYKKQPTQKDYDDLYSYCIQDIRAERELSKACPPMTKGEEEIFLLDQKINARGVCVDIKGLDACINLLQKIEQKYTLQLRKITGERVQTVGEVSNTLEWCHSNGVYLPNLKANTVSDTLERNDIPDHVRRVLTIRSILGSNSVKKLYAIKRMVSRNGRLHDLFQYYGAERTGRFAGHGPQPQNLPAEGPKIVYCKHCNKYGGLTGPWCPRCGTLQGEDYDTAEWNIDAVEQALADILNLSIPEIEEIWGNPVKLISGCLRGLFVAAPGYELICSDYSAIEAVILAVLAEEEWRIEVFRTHGKIYEACASKITGVPLDEILNHKKTHGQHHPLRKKFGKIPELLSGYQGWVGAYKRAGVDKYMSEDEMKECILKWRADSPNIAGIKHYGEIVHYGIWQGLEEAARSAICEPGKWYSFKRIGYIVKGNVLYCLLPSGRYLCYHRPQVSIDGQISYEGWNSNYLKGPVGWIRLDTYGGALTENVVQATARDILTYGMPNIEKAGYPIVLHVHDEIVAEVPIGYGSIAHFEQIMSTLPQWAMGWPIKAKGGWRGHRYRKD